MLPDGIVEGRRIFANTLKYVLMGTSRTSGTCSALPAASLSCRSCRCCPPDPAQQPALRPRPLAIPTDRVDPELLRATRALGHRASSASSCSSSARQLALRPLHLRAARVPRRPRRSAAAGSSSPWPPRPGGARHPHRRDPFSAAGRAWGSSSRPVTCTGLSARCSPLRASSPTSSASPPSRSAPSSSWSPSSSPTFRPHRDHQGPLLRWPGPPSEGSGQPGSNATSGASNGAPPTSFTTPPHNHVGLGQCVSASTVWPNTLPCGSSPIRTRVEKGGDHDGTVKRKGLLRQLQHLRRAVCHQDPACAGKQLEKGTHPIRLLWELRSARLLTASPGAP